MSKSTTVEDRLDTITKSLGDLATVVRDMAVHVYKEGQWGEEEYESMEKMPPMDVQEEEEMFEEEISLADESPDEDDSDDSSDSMDKSKTVKRASRLTKTGRKIGKGFADRSLKTADEEDSPFDEQQNDVKGNEPQPAGAMGGDRTDETFNANFAAIMDEVNSLKKTIEDSGLTVTRAVTPPPGTIRKGRESTSEDTSGIVTRDVESEVKKRSWREINSLREEVGDLPRHAFNI